MIRKDMRRVPRYLSADTRIMLESFRDVAVILIGSAALVLSLAALVLFVSHATSAKTLEVLAGTVERVKDGDTVVFSSGDRNIDIRLANIDAPEVGHPGKPGQPFGLEAKAALETMSLYKSCTADVVDHDQRYGREVALLDCGTPAEELAARGPGHVNRKLVEGGFAWVYQGADGKPPHYNHDTGLPGIQTQARIARAGLWALPEAQRVPPWEFRHPTPVSGSPSECRTLKCSQLLSCADAMNALVRCPRSKLLDGDGDGKPCESLCR